jgi:hypothetical protein
MPMSAQTNGIDVIAVSRHPLLPDRSRRIFGSQRKTP